MFNMMSNKEFSEAVKNYLNNGWVIHKTGSEESARLMLIQFSQWDDTGLIWKMIELSATKGVRIKSALTDWCYTDWNKYNSLTACL
jgi:hypothetical protein